MGLQAWYPLINDMHNQGVGDTDLTLKTSPTFGDGKIGGALISGGTSSWTASQTEKVMNNTSISVCFWVYIDAPEGDTNKRAMFFGNNQKRLYSLFCYPTCNDFHWSWYSYDASGEGKSKMSDVLKGVLPSYHWTHVAITYNNPDGKIYINGQLKHEFSCVMDNYTFSNDTNVIYECQYRKLCDFRVYDTALSPREVKEISKGLVLHYPLAMPGGENILKNSLTNFPQLWDGSGDGRTLTTQSGVSVPEWGCNDGLRVYGKSGASNALCLLINGLTHGLTVSSTSVSGQKYTPSIYIKNNHQNAMYIAFNGLGTGQTINQGEIKRVILNATGNGKSYLQFTISASGANKEYDFTFWHPKIELGEVCTPWVPATTDSLYSAMGFNDGIEYDVSGYGYNGTKTGSFAYDADTPRYNTSTCFNQTDTRITPPIIFQSGAKIPEISFSFWMKRNDYTDAKNHYIYNDICQIYTYSDYLLRISWKHDTESSSAGNTSASSLAITTPNEWHHICYTFDKGILRLYIDGEFKYGSDRTDTGQFMGVYNIGSIGYASGSNTSYGGCLSDFRIYATALTFDQIKDLYHTPISLANNGTLLTQSEYEEV